MRLTTVQRMQLSDQGKRLDPPFYFGKIEINDLLDGDELPHVLLYDLLENMYEGTRLPLVDRGIPLLRLSNLRPCEVDFQNVGYINPDAARSCPILHEGDVLFTRSAEPFRAAVVPPGIPTPVTVSSEITILRPRPAVLPEYLAAVLSSTYFTKIMWNLAYQRSSRALPRLHMVDVARLPILLPRRSIQEKIKHLYIQVTALTRQARDEMDQVVRTSYAEINSRLGKLEKVKKQFTIQRANLDDSRWDVSYNKGRILRESLMEVAVMRPLLQLARPVPSSLKGIDENDYVLAIQANNVNENTFLVEVTKQCRLADLSARMRQPLAIGDVLLCTTGSGRQIAYVDEELGNPQLPILGSATFTALRFNKTSRYFAVALSHPIVRKQLDLIASGSIQRFVNKRDLDDLLIPCLSTVWREDFDSRVSRAFERRREALNARATLLNETEKFIAEDRI